MFFSSGTSTFETQVIGTKKAQAQELSDKTICAKFQMRERENALTTEEEARFNRGWGKENFLC